MVMCIVCRQDLAALRRAEGEQLNGYQRRTEKIERAKRERAARLLAEVVYARAVCTASMVFNDFAHGRS